MDGTDKDIDIDLNTDIDVDIDLSSSASLIKFSLLLYVRKILIKDSIPEQLRSSFARIFSKLRRL